MLEQRIKATFGEYQVPAVVHVVQGDTGRVFVFESQDRQMAGTETAALMCIRPNGTAFSYSGVIDSDENTITVDMDDAGGAFTQAGVVAAQLVLQEGGLVLCSFKLGIIVQEVLGGAASPEDITFLAGLQAQLDAWITTAATVYVPKTDGFVNGKSLPAELYVQDIPSKNLLPNNAVTAEINGITFTVASDGTITATGTASATTLCNIIENYPLASGTYILSGCPAGGDSDNSYTLRVRFTDSATMYNDNGDGVTVNATGGKTIYALNIRIASGYAIPSGSPLVFRPMLRLSTITDDTYVPYAKTNVELSKLKTQTAQLLSEFSLPTSFTTKSVSWQDYDLLIVCSAYYQSLTTSTVVPVDYFKGTSSASMVYLTDATSTGTVYNLYQNGNDSIYVKTTSSSASRGLMIYGIKFAM